MNYLEQYVQGREQVEIWSHKGGQLLDVMAFADYSIEVEILEQKLLEAMEGLA